METREELEANDKLAKQLMYVQEKLIELLKKGWTLFYDDEYYIMDKHPISISHIDLDKLVHIVHMDLQGED